jgi:cell division protease FtsH
MGLLARNLTILFNLLAFVFVCLLFYNLEQRLPQRDFSELSRDVAEHNVSAIEFTGDSAAVTLRSDIRYETRVPNAAQFVQQLSTKDTEISFRKDYSLYYFSACLLGLIALIGIVSWLSLAAAGEGGKKKKFASDKLIRPGGKNESVTFDDVAGVPEAKEELQEVVSFLKNPQQFSKLGAFMPKGLLLQGPPGTGKTLLARAVAGEAGVPFFSFSGSDFVEMFVGVGASRVRDLFREAKAQTPCIVFIDEIDAVGSSRVAMSSDGQDERGQTLNALLVEMDGFSSSDNVIVIAATNRPDILDPALSRPGRFDRRVTILPPDVKGRVKILGVHCRKVVLSPDLDLEEIAQMTSGFSGAELANLVNEAALLAGRDKAECITKDHFDQARDRVLLGVERRGMVITDADKAVLANHEAGHAIVAKMLPGSDPIHKISIIPRGRALGQTQQLPLGDRTAYSKPYLLDRITTLMGGNAAEMVVFGHRTTQNENDLVQATEIAMNMVCRWGMSDVLGPQAYKIGETGFLGEERSAMSSLSSDTARLIDREVKHVLATCYKKAEEILRRERQFLKTLSQILIQVETVDAEEFDIIFQCSLTKKAEAEGKVKIESECSVCPAKGNCAQYHGN